MKSILLGIVLAIASVGAWATEPAPQQIVIHKAVDSLAPSNANNVVTYGALRSIPVGALGLKEAGLKAGALILQADEVRIFANRRVMNESPKARLFLNSREGGQWWYHTGGQGSAENHVIQPGEAVVVITRASTQPIAWRNPLAD